MSAVLLAVAFSPLPFSWILFFGLVPWLHGLKGLNGKQAWAHGYRFGVLFSYTQLFWIAVLASRWTGNNLLALLPWTAAALLMALYYGLMGVLVARCLKANRLWLIPLVWAGVEVFRSYIPVFAFPWNLFASPFYSWTPVVQSAHVGGIYLVSAWVVFTNVLIATEFDPRAMFSDRLTANERWNVRRLAIIWLSPVVISLIFFALPAQTVNKKFVVVQPGVDLAFGDPARQDYDVSIKINAALAEAKKSPVDLVVMPEGVGGHIPSLPPSVPFMVNDNLPMLFGGKLGTDKIYQTAFAWDGRWQIEKKTRLVIFGEFVPFRSAMPFLSSSFSLPSGDISASDEGVHSLEINHMTVGPILCFEGLFPDITYKQLLNGSQVLAIMSVDDWYMGTAAPEQLRQASCWRAIETGLPVVRAASLGFSMAADSKGKVLFQAPLQTTHSELVEVPIVKDAPTWPAYTALLFACISFGSGLWVLFFDRPPRSPKRNRR